NEVISWAKICSRVCFCLSRSLTISSKDPSGLVFSSCDKSAPVSASMLNIASQQGQTIVKRPESLIYRTDECADDNSDVCRRTSGDSGWCAPKDSAEEISGRPPNRMRSFRD